MLTNKGPFVSITTHPTLPVCFVIMTKHRKPKDSGCDCEDWETPESKKIKRKARQFQIDNFVSDMEYIHVNGSYQRKSDRITVLVADAKKTSSQIRYERDVRERVTEGAEYYRLKRIRDQQQRAKQGKRKSAPVAVCDICSKPVNNHCMWCRKADATPVKAIATTV